MTSREYLDRGVSPTKEDVHAAIRHVSRGIAPGAFCKIILDVGGDESFAAVMHADGAGTKSTLAYLVAKETGDVSAFRGIAQDSAVMNVDDVICVGAVDEFLLSNTIGRNAHRVGGDVLEQIIRGYSDFAETMTRHGVRITLAGGETADVGDLVQTIIVDSTVYVRMRRADIVDCSKIRPGDVIVGLSSAGQATYETRPNSGIGSNGLTLARHVLLHKEYARKYPETYSPTVAEDKVYVGKFALGDRLPGSSLTVGEALLSPTRTYAPIVRELLGSLRSSISGLIHCTGGGQVKCRHFGQGLHYVKRDLFEPPALFQAIQDASGMAWREMYEVFNMGHRMEVYCQASAADAVVATAERFGVAARVIGEVLPATKGDVGNRVTIHAAGQEYSYP